MNVVACDNNVLEGPRSQRSAAPTLKKNSVLTWASICSVANFLLNDALQISCLKQCTCVLNLFHLLLLFAIHGPSFVRQVEYNKKGASLCICAIPQCQLFNLVPSCIYQVQARAKSFPWVNTFRFYISFPLFQVHNIVFKLFLLILSITFTTSGIYQNQLWSFKAKSFEPWESRSSLDTAFFSPDSSYIFFFPPMPCAPWQLRRSFNFANYLTPHISPTHRVYSQRYTGYVVSGSADIGLWEFWGMVRWWTSSPREFIRTNSSSPCNNFYSWDFGWTSYISCEVENRWELWFWKLMQFSLIHFNGRPSNSLRWFNSRGLQVSFSIRKDVSVLSTTDIELLTPPSGERVAIFLQIEEAPENFKVARFIIDPTAREAQCALWGKKTIWKRELWTKFLIAKFSTYLKSQWSRLVKYLLYSLTNIGDWSISILLLIYKSYIGTTVTLQAMWTELLQMLFMKLCIFILITFLTETFVSEGYIGLVLIKAFARPVLYLTLAQT